MTTTTAAQQPQAVPDIWIIRVGLMTALVLVAMTVLGAWLVAVARWKAATEVDMSEDGNFEAVIHQPATNPISLQNSIGSPLWNKRANGKGHTTTSQPANQSPKSSARGKFAILGDDDDDDEHKNDSSSSPNDAHDGRSNGSKP
jgi:hypothetical protein